MVHYNQTRVHSNSPVPLKQSALKIKPGRVLRPEADRAEVPFKAIGDKDFQGIWKQIALGEKNK